MMDDDDVSGVSLKHVLNLADAYLLFYMRDDKCANNKVVQQLVENREKTPKTNGPSLLSLVPMKTKLPPGCTITFVSFDFSL